MSNNMQLVGAVTIIVAAYLGAWLGRRNEHTKWLREQRLQVYAEWLGALEEEQVRLGTVNRVTSSIQNVVNVQKGIAIDDPEGLRKMKDVIADLTKFDEMNEGLYVDVSKQTVIQRSIYNRLQILAGQRMREKAERVNSSITQLTLSRLGNKLEEKEQEELRVLWRDTVEEFQMEARKELGLK